MLYLHDAIRFFWIFLLLSCAIIFGHSSVHAQYEPAPPSFYQQHSEYINSVDFTEDSSVPLQGQWLFYPQQFLTESSAVLAPRVVSLPASTTCEPASVASAKSAVASRRCVP